MAQESTTLWNGLSPGAADALLRSSGLAPTLVNPLGALMAKLGPETFIDAAASLAGAEREIVPAEIVRERPELRPTRWLSRPERPVQTPVWNDSANAPFGATIPVLRKRLQPSELRVLLAVVPISNFNDWLDGADCEAVHDLFRLWRDGRLGGTVHAEALSTYAADKRLVERCGLKLTS